MATMTNKTLLVLPSEWPGTNFATGEPTKMPVGTHEVEIVPHPSLRGMPIMVLKGTMIGRAEGHFRDWADPAKSPHAKPEERVKIIEDGPSTP